MDGKSEEVGRGIQEEARLVRIYCEYCKDNRAIEFRDEPYPCPMCAKFVVDERKLFSSAGKRYGNPFIHSQHDYENFKSRRALDNFRPYPRSSAELSEIERQKFKHLCGTYPEAHERFCMVWARYSP